MKQKLNKITSVILFCLVLVFSGCEKEELSGDNTMINQEPKIAEAKNWFENYKAQGDFIPIFQDINYRWNEAAITVLEDGSTAITVPLMDMNQDPEYKGEKILYLYPSEEGYQAIVYELSPDQNQKEKNEGFKNLESYNGYISTWDLKEGFIKGAKFANSSATQAVAFKVFSQEDLESLSKTSKQIDLLPVVIIAGGSGGGYSYGVNPAIGMGDNIGNYNTGNYFIPSIKGGGGSGTGTGSTNTPSVDNDEVTIVDKIDDSQLDPCYKKIMDALKTGKICEIATVFDKLNADPSKYMVTFKNGSTTADAAETKRTDPKVPFVYTITIDTERNTSGTQLFKASVLLHELTHAYFNSLYDDYKSSSPLNSGGLISTPTLFQAYVDKTYPKSSGDEHHTEMAKTYVEAISSALQEYQTGVTVPYGNALQEYRDLAWGGLMKTDVYNKLPEADRIRIENRYKAEINGMYAGGQYAIGKPCN